MRIAIISDIHSNLEALIKALEIIKQQSIEKIICLGDVIGYGANPNECVELIRQNCSTVIKGNHEEALENIEVLNNLTTAARDAILWTRRQLIEENINYLRTLPLLEKKDDIVYVHASPCNPAKWDYILDVYEARRAFLCFSESLCFIGHTHTPVVFSKEGRVQSIIKGERYLVNIGSVGQPRDNNVHLSFGILDTETWGYKNIRSPYDVETTIGKILKTDLPAKHAHRLLFGI